MLHVSAQSIAQTKGRTLALTILVLLETLLVTTALVPAQLWTHLLPNSPNAALDGPFPSSVALIIPPLLYIVPTLVGFLSRRWQHALFYATLPAWIGLGLFVTAASFKVGAFNLVSADSVTGNVSILELFAALGGLGWLAQAIFQSRHVNR
ncbi:MAG: hypothetical protein ACRDHZ_26910 [Ktedonobacteraceae bacterium]